MFLGVTTLNLDVKGRLAIPAKHRDALAACCASRVVATINPWEGCVWIYPENEWQEIARKVAHLPTANRQNRLMKRMLLGNASELEMDGQGRILLAPNLRQHGGLDKQVALVGDGNKFEVWDADTYLREHGAWLDEAKDPGSELSEELANLAL